MTVPAPLEPVPDGDLIRGWQNGDEAAATELVRRHAGPLARFLRGSGATDDELEDLVQETLFRAFRNIGGFRGRSSFRTWIMTIGANALKDSWRRRKRRQVVPLAGREVEDAGSDPHGEAASRDLETRLMTAVQALPEMQREVFLLRAQQGIQYEEIARALDTSPGAARVHYHHAVKRLKKYLDT